MADDPFKKEQAIENGIYFLKGIKVIILGRRESSVQLRLSPRSSAPAFRLPNIHKRTIHLRTHVNTVDMHYILE